MDGPSESQHDGDTDTSNATNVPQPRIYWFSCDCCERLVPPHEARHSCQECNNFDYCEKCVRNAALIHPGHSFTKLDAPEPVPESEGDIIAIPEVEEASSKPDCKSCGPMTRVLSTLRFDLDPELNPKAATSPRKDVVIEWSLRLSSLVEATQRNCPFCCFFLHTFFRKSNGQSYYYIEESPWYARPNEHDKQRMELVEHCMGTLTRLKTDHFDFDVYPVCSRRGLKPWDFDKLRFTLSRSTMKHHSTEELKQAEVFHSAGVITAERYVYAVKGT
jgi:hypothetical protein